MANTVILPRWSVIVLCLVVPFVSIADPILHGEGEYESAPHGQGNVYAPEVLFDGGIYRMWYGGQGRDGHDRILYAESTDGIHWIRKGVAIEDPTANHLNDPSVVVIDGVYRLFYTRAARGAVDEIDSAVSSDAIHWKPLGVMVSPGKSKEWDCLSVGRPAVIFDEGVYKMWFDGRKDLPPPAADGMPTSASSMRSVGYATSRHGVHWTKHPTNPVFGHDAGGVDVKRIDGIYWMVYESHEGTMLAESDDGIGWKDRGLWIAKSKDAGESAGHVTPSLFSGPHGLQLFYGAASTATWDHNAIASKNVALPKPVGSEVPKAQGK